MRSQDVVAGERCDKCHPKGFELVPKNHTAAFKKGKHKALANKDPAYCDMCHPPFGDSVCARATPASCTPFNRRGKDFHIYVESRVLARQTKGRRPRIAAGVLASRLRSDAGREQEVHMKAEARNRTTRPSATYDMIRTTGSSRSLDSFGCDWLSDCSGGLSGIGAASRIDALLFVGSQDGRCR